MSLRKIIETRDLFPRQEAGFKLLYLALEHIAKRWTMPVVHWEAALQRFATSAWRPRSESGAGVNRSGKKKSEEAHPGMGLCPKPEILALLRQNSCGMRAPESVLGLHLRRALPSTQVRSVY